MKFRRVGGRCAYKHFPSSEYLACRTTQNLEPQPRSGRSARCLESAQLRLGETSANALQPPDAGGRNHHRINTTKTTTVPLPKAAAARVLKYQAEIWC